MAARVPGVPGTGEVASSVISIIKTHFTSVTRSHLASAQRCVTVCVQVLSRLCGGLYGGQGLGRKRLHSCRLGSYGPTPPLPDLTGEGESLDPIGKDDIHSSHIMQTLLQTLLLV